MKNFIKILFKKKDKQQDTIQSLYKRLESEERINARISILNTISVLKNKIQL